MGGVSGRKEWLSLGGLPAGAHCHQGDQEENAAGGQDDV